MPPPRWALDTARVMSRQKVDVVRQPLAVADRSRRRFEEHLVRFPRGFEFLAATIWRLYLRLPPRSRLRQAIVRRFIQGGFEAVNRGDFDATFARYDPAVESIWDPELVALGFDPVMRGRKARIKAQRQWEAEWGNLRLEPEELIDLGDGRLVIPVWVRATGLSSGAPAHFNGAFIFTVSRGRAIHERVFLHRSDALEAAGLRE